MLLQALEDVSAQQSADNEAQPGGRRGLIGSGYQAYMARVGGAGDASTSADPDLLLRAVPDAPRHRYIQSAQNSRSTRTYDALHRGPAVGGLWSGSPARTSISLAAYQPGNQAACLEAEVNCMDHFRRDQGPLEQLMQRYISRDKQCSDRAWECNEAAGQVQMSLDPSLLGAETYFPDGGVVYHAPGRPSVYVSPPRSRKR